MGAGFSIQLTTEAPSVIGRSHYTSQVTDGEGDAAWVKHPDR